MTSIGCVWRLRSGSPATPAGEFALGYVLTNDAGRVLTSAGSQTTLSPAASGPQSDASVRHRRWLLRLAPTRFGSAWWTRSGRRGTVVHRLELPKLEAVDMSDQRSDRRQPAGGGRVAGTARRAADHRPASLRDISSSICAQSAGRRIVTVTLEIAEGESSPALATETLTLRPGETPTSRIATGFVRRR